MTEDSIGRRLRRQPEAVVGLVVLGVLVLVAVAAPLITWLEGADPNTFHHELVDSALGGVPKGSWGGVSADHWLGVEPGTGRDLLARVAYGARVSLGVALLATVLQVTLGTLIGLSAGLGGRWADAVLGRVTDVSLAFPGFMFAIALLGIVPTSVPRPLVLAVVLGVLGWAGVARVVRGQALSLRTMDYVTTARLYGASGARIAWREVAPGLASTLITYAALMLPGNVAAEAGLSLLGIGVREPTPSWGAMLTSARTWFRPDPMYVIVPSLCIFATVLAMSLLADGLRKALDPRAESHDVRVI